MCVSLCPSDARGLSGHDAFAVMRMRAALQKLQYVVTTAENNRAVTDKRSQVRASAGSAPTLGPGTDVQVRTFFGGAFYDEPSRFCSRLPPPIAARSRPARATIEAARAPGAGDRPAVQVVLDGRVRRRRSRQSRGCARVDLRANRAPRAGRRRLRAARRP